jgi:hypothetical protein
MKKTNDFFNPETDPDPDQKPTFEQKTRSRSRPTAKSQFRRALLHTLLFDTGVEKMLKTILRFGESARAGAGDAVTKL